MKQDFIKIGNVIFRVDEIRAITYNKGNDSNNAYEYVAPNITINKNNVITYDNVYDMMNDFISVTRLLTKFNSDSKYILFTTINTLEDIFIEWNSDNNAVEIKGYGEHFLINASQPSFYCNWNMAIKYFENNKMWKLPTKKQLEIMIRHYKDINNVINLNGGFNYYQGWFWTNEEFDNIKAVKFDVGDCEVKIVDKHESNFVHAVCVL
jgi:hypothetical protein